jgi:O-antigen/teichoic acid export membrane protein
LNNITNTIINRLPIKWRTRINGQISSNFSQRIILNSFWSFTGEILSKGLTFLSWIVIARLLGKTGYGEFGIIRTTITMFAVFGGMGLGLTANRFVSENRVKDKKYSGQIIGLTQIIAAFSGLLISVSVFFSSNYLATSVLKAPQLENELKITAVMLFFSAINGAQIGTIQGLEAYRRLAVTNIYQCLLSFPLFVVGTYYWGLTGSVIAYALSIIISTILLEISIKKEIKKQDIVIIYSKIPDILPIFWKFSLPAALAGIAVSPFKWFSEALLAKYGGFGDLGIFQASLVATNIIIAITSTLNAPLISISANLGNLHENRKIQFLTVFGSWYLFLIFAIPFLLFPNLLILLFGKQFNEPNLYNVSLLLLLWCGMLMYYQGIIRIITLNNSLWFGFFTNIFEGLTLISAFYFFKGLGVIGLGYAYVLSYIVRIIVSLPFLIKTKMITLNLLFDKYFIMSFLTFFTIIVILLKNNGL